jgi:N-acetyl-gamma-glutamylphosphate reductase
MAPRIFVAGVSGYTGGHLVDRLSQAHPEYHVVAIVRGEAQGNQVTDKYPKLETVLGDLDSHDVLVKEGGRRT